MLVEMQNGTAAAETVWLFLKKFNIEFHMLQQFLDLYPENPKSGAQTDTRTPMFTAVLVTTAKRCK